MGSDAELEILHTLQRAVANLRNRSDTKQFSEVSELWSQRAAALSTPGVPSSWTELPYVLENYINPLISGSGEVGWLEFVARKYYPRPVKRALSLGCGGGGLERHGCSLNLAESFDAYDISDGALELARKLAKAEGMEQHINYRTADLNRLELPRNYYDAVFASQSVHHIENLNHYLDQVQSTLIPGGLFVVNEYVGPNQFQWTDKQIERSQALLYRLPEKYRQLIRGTGVKRNIWRLSISEMNIADPTEAICSADILTGIQNRFGIVEKRDFGGTLLHLVLDDIAGNFTGSDEDTAFIRMMMDEEQRLIRSGEISSDFTLVIARNPQ